MKLKNIFKTTCTAITIFSLGACMDIDQAPMSEFDSEKFFETEAQIEYYVNDMYGILPSHGNWSYGTFGSDNNTDNMSDKGYSNAYVPGEWKVGQTGGSWGFGNIYKYNYMIERVIPKLENNQIQGNRSKINHYLGEAYFFRAWEYFNKLQSLGDFPIIETTLPNDLEKLVAESKRMPRSEVARFILSDLDKAIDLLMNNIDGRKNRVSKNAALLIKSRVALYEGTWLKYFKNSAFVPNGPGWPGASKSYNANYQFQAGSIDAEISYLLGESMKAAKEVADNVALVDNNGVLQQSESDPVNPYVNMFSDVDMSKYSEVILWREYSRAYGIVHNVPVGAQTGSYMSGLTRGFVDNFLMKNGLPIYAAGSGYQGDDYIKDVRMNRDDRLFLFLKEPDQKNVLYNINLANRGNLIEKYPNIIEGNREQGYSTGYTPRKGGTFDGAQLEVNGECYTGSITLRASEAYLNYMEAVYEKEGKLDGTATNYWKDLRRRAKVDEDFNKTVQATDMTQEAKNDWGAYSAGQLIDPTLYNIRRERRSEFIAEGMRWMDLKRWRAFDQLIKKPYQIEGFKLWGPMKEWYKNAEGKSTLIYGDKNANVSAPELGIYMRPQEINTNSLILKNGGCKWAMAHYLDPIAIQHFLITGGVDESNLYQNPFWPTRANEGPLQ